MLEYSDSCKQEIAEFLEFAGFGAICEQPYLVPKLHHSLDANFVQTHSVKKRYASFVYLFADEELDDLGCTEQNGTSSSTSSAISKFDSWFCSFLQHDDAHNQNKQKLAEVVSKMLAMECSFPPFARVCFLAENDRGVVLAHFINQVSKKNGSDLKANSKGLLMTAFQRAFRHFDAKHGLHTLSTMTTWKKHPSYKDVKKQCTKQLKKDASIPLAKQDGSKTIPMDLKTYRLLLEFLVQKQNQTFQVNLGDYCYYLNADFAVHTLMFGGPRGCTELAEGLSILSFVKLEHNLLHFLQSGITKGNQTGGDSNFTVKNKPDLYFLGENLVHHFDIFRKRTTHDGEFVNTRLFLKPLPSAKFTDDIWFGNVHVGKNNINYVQYITEEMKDAGIIPSYLKFDNTSLRKLRTAALTDAGIEDWMTAESMGQKDKKFMNLGYYRKMDHEDKLLMAKVLEDPWRYTKKRTIVQEVDGSFFPDTKRPLLQFETCAKENIPPPLFSNTARPTREVPIPHEEQLEKLQRNFTLNNCSNVVFNVYLGNSTQS